MFFPAQGRGKGRRGDSRFSVSAGEHSAGNQPAPTGVGKKPTRTHRKSGNHPRPTDFGIPDGLREVLSRPTGAALYGWRRGIEK